MTKNFEREKKSGRWHKIAWPEKEKKCSLNDKVFRCAYGWRKAGVATTGRDDTSEIGATCVRWRLPKYRVALLRFFCNQRSVIQAHSCAEGGSRYKFASKGKKSFLYQEIHHVPMHPKEREPDFS